MIRRLGWREESSLFPVMSCGETYSTRSLVRRLLLILLTIMIDRCRSEQVISLLELQIAKIPDTQLTALIMVGGFSSSGTLLPRPFANTMTN